MQTVFKNLAQGRNSSVVVVELGDHFTQPKFGAKSNLVRIEINSAILSMSML